MPLPFRQRIFVILVALTAVPTALAVVGWALAVRTVAPSAGGRGGLGGGSGPAPPHLSARGGGASRAPGHRLPTAVAGARRGEPPVPSWAGGAGGSACWPGRFAGAGGAPGPPPRRDPRKPRRERRRPP